MRDGDFIVCWLDRDSEESARTLISHGLPPVVSETEEAVKPAFLRTCHIQGSSEFPLAFVSHW